jgi:hypothetical protein
MRRRAKSNASLHPLLLPERTGESTIGEPFCGVFCAATWPAAPRHNQQFAGCVAEENRINLMVCIRDSELWL